MLPTPRLTSSYAYVTLGVHPIKKPEHLYDDGLSDMSLLRKRTFGNRRLPQVSQPNNINIQATHSVYFISLYLLATYPHNAHTKPTQDLSNLFRDPTITD